MDWKLNLLIGVGVLTLVASVMGSLEQILKSLKWVVWSMLKAWYQPKGTWPLKVIIRSANLSTQISTTNIMVTLLLKPRKPINLGQCEIVYLVNGFKTKPKSPVELNDFQEWKVGDDLDKPKTYELSFNAPGVELGHEVQIQVESEGHECKSNVMTVS